MLPKSGGAFLFHRKDDAPGQITLRPTKPPSWEFLQMVSALVKKKCVPKMPSIHKVV